MKIAYNPKTAVALTAAPSNNDITFDLPGQSIYVKGVKFDGKAYSIFKKYTSATAGGYNGLVPAPSYNDGSTNRFLKEDGTWGVPEGTGFTIVSSTASGLAPKIGTVAVSTVTTQADEWVLTSTKGATPTWRKLPTNAFLNYYRPILVNGTSLLGNNNTALNIAAGTNINLTTDAGKVTINNGLTKLSQLTDDILSGKYLPLTGGTLEGSGNIVLRINTSSEDKSVIGFKNGSISNSVYFGIVSDGTFKISSPGATNWYKIWHSGNDGHASGLDADTLDGKHLNKIFSNEDWSSISGVTDANQPLFGAYYFGGTTQNMPNTYGQLIAFNGLSGEYGGMQLFSYSNKLHYRNHWDDKWGEWRQLAFIDSNITGNAASADKVKNSLILKINSGTTEDTDLYTYDGSSTKTLDIKWGTGIKFVNTQGSLQIYNSGVRSISTGITNGTIRVNTDGTSIDVPVKGLGSAAYKETNNFLWIGHKPSNMNGSNTYDLNNSYDSDCIIHDYQWTNGPNNKINSVINLVYQSDWKNQLAFTPSLTTISYRSYSGSTKGWSNWKTIAFTDSDITGNAATADKLKTKRKLWGQDFDGTANVSGDMTGVGIINTIFNLKTQSGNASLYLETAIANTDYAHIFVSNKNDNKTHAFRPLVLQYGYGNVGIGAPEPTHKLTVNGDVKATSFIGNLDGTYVNKLTGYTKATSASDLVTTDTLNTALGKLEYKAGIAYSWYRTITEDDTDEIINKWDEVVDFVNNLEVDLTDEFVTRKTAQIITGTKTFASRLTLSNGIDYKIVLNNTQAEESKIQGISFQQDGVQYGALHTWGSNDILWNNHKIWHDGNDGSGSGLDADLLDGINAEGFLRRFSSWLDTDNTKDANNLLGGATFAYKGHSNTATTGVIVSFNSQNWNSYTLQLQGDYQNNQFYFRNLNGDNHKWGTWNKIIHSNNYTDYINSTNFPGLAGVRSVTINSDYLKVDTNGTVTNLTIPFAEKTTALKMYGQDNTIVVGLPHHTFGDLNTEFGTTGTGQETYLKNYTKKLVKNHSTISNRVGVGQLNPNSTHIGMFRAYSMVDYNNTGMPQYCSGFGIPLRGKPYMWGTYEGTWYYQDIALVSDIPTSLKNPNVIKFKNISGTEVSYDGSTAVDLTEGINYATKATSLKHTSLTTGQDLNTLTTEGVYSHTYTTVCNSLVNGPTGRSNGECRLEVINCGSSKHTLQLLYTKAGKSGEIWYRMGTSDATWSTWKKLAFVNDIPKVTDYYWANVKISSTSSTTTTPTFAKVITPRIENSENIKLVTTAAEKYIYLRYNDKENQQVVFTGQYFAPSSSSTGKISLGNTSDRWLGVYANNGYFKNNVLFEGIRDFTNYPETGTYKMGRTNVGDIHFKGNQDNKGNSITWSWGYDTQVDAGIYVKHAGKYGSKMYFATTNLWDDGPKAAIEIDNNGIVSIFRNDLKVLAGNITANKTVTAGSGFVKIGSSNSYVLLGGGGHKAISDFLLKSEIANQELSANLTTITKSLTVTADWMDTGISGTDLTTGTYIVQLSVSANNSTDALYDCFWSGVLTWFSGKNYTTTNDTEADEILLHRSGHAYHNTIYLRTIMTTSTDGRGLKLQIAANKNLGAAYTYTFKFKRII